MANIKSQKKRNITNEKRHERNKSVKAELKTRTKRVETILCALCPQLKQLSGALSLLCSHERLCRLVDKQT